VNDDAGIEFTGPENAGHPTKRNESAIVIVPEERFETGVAFGNSACVAAHQHGDLCLREMLP
jgi:hypothetical protein